MARMRLALLVLAIAASSAEAQIALAPGPIFVDRSGNGVLDPGETAEVEPSWQNVSQFPPTICGLGGSLGGFTGPAGATYSIVDGSGYYAGCFSPMGGPVRCSDCYSVRASGARPASHWDATAFEGPAGVQHPWVLHVGGTFTDVPVTSPFYRYVETLVHEGVTAGCAPSAYCPGATISREQLAVFVLLAKEPPSYLPPACGTPMFADVPASSPFCRWIEELARRGVVTGCGAANFCPAGAVTREQVAVFVTRTASPNYTPPACTTPMFADVPASSPFCRWIEDLARRSIITGCGGGNYCPAAPLNREQMSVYLTLVFSLVLYR